MLEAHHLVKRFFGIPALKDVSFVVRPGEILGYLGPNGSGKTTTTRILTGLLESSSGTVTFHGRDIRDDLIGFRRRLGYVPDEPHLYPFLSGREFLEFVGRLRDVPASLLDRKIQSMFELFSLSDAASESLNAYSRGMKQKILIIAALLHDPDILILDEPESGLDVTAALVLRELMRILAAQGKAILYSSHVLEVVEQLCGRVVVLDHGSVVAHESIDYLRNLVASNSLEGVLSRLLLRMDPERRARDIAEVVALHE